MSLDELGAPGSAIAFEPIAVPEKSPVAAEFVPDADKSSAYQSEAALEAAFIALLQGQAWEYLPITSADELEANLRGPSSMPRSGDGAVPTAGTAITCILPPTSRFSAANNHAAKKQTVMTRLGAFFDRYFALVWRDTSGDRPAPRP